MSLVKTEIHKLATHRGAFSIWTEVLESRVSKNGARLANAHLARRSLIVLTKVSEKAIAVVGIVSITNADRKGYAPNGTIGVLEGMGRDAVCAEDIELIAKSGVDYVAVVLSVETKGESYKRSVLSKARVNQNGLFE